MSEATHVGERSKHMARLSDGYGPWAVVTGASDGIGRAITLQLGAAGLNVVVVARRAERLRTLATELAKTAGVDTRVIADDLGTDDGIARVIADTADLDIGLFVAAAGFGSSGGFLDQPIGQELGMLGVNCGAVVALTHAFGGRMAGRGRGGIVLFSSIVAFQGVERSANYAATKAYIHTFGEGIRRELAARGVDVLLSAPGPVESGFGERADLRMGSGVSTEVVATRTLRALGRRRLVRPGALSKVLGWSLATAPRRVRTFIMSRIFVGFTKHQ